MRNDLALFGGAVGAFALVATFVFACATNDAAPSGFDDDAGCAAPRVICSSACVDERSDPKNCGGCGVVCAPGDVCSGGRCGQTCPVGRAACTGACVDLTSDPTNCGRCGVLCDEGLSCVEGTCACSGSLERCGDFCVDTTTDARNCGACGTVCDLGLLCVAGKCAGCGPNETRCRFTNVGPASPVPYDYCVNLQTGFSDCGGCGKICGETQICTDGKCACGPLETDCDGGCFDTRFDKSHCGSCTKTCTTSCRNGACL